MEALTDDEVQTEILEREIRKPLERTNIFGDEGKFASERVPRDRAVIGVEALRRALWRAPLPQGCSGCSEFRRD